MVMGTFTVGLGLGLGLGPMELRVDVRVPRTVVLLPSL